MPKLNIIRKIVLKLRHRAFLIGLYAFLLILFISTLAALYQFIFHNPIKKELDTIGTIRTEVIKSLLQILVVALIGGTVAATFKAFEKNRENSQIRIKTKIDFTKQLYKLYRTIKSIRRKLKSKGIVAKHEDDNIVLNKGQLDIYIEQLDVLDEIQLELEGLTIEAANFRLFDECERLTEYLKKMCHYVRQINEEYEKLNQSFDMTAGVNLITLEHLQEFTFSAGKPFTFKKKQRVGHRFKSNLSEPFHEILKILY
jgi:hypothetical protein